jgi:hypothetical protein
MADEQRPAIGLSIGATNLAAVTADRSVTRKPVLTLYRQRAPEVGVPAENAALTEPGVVLTDFVGRVGDPAGITAPDGTVHSGEALLADALRALAYTATDGRALPAAAVTYPAHWGRPAAAALRTALNRVPEWSGERIALLADAAAALTALRNNPGLPARGIVAVCDFGGSGTNLTLVDAADGYRPVAPSVRHTDFSGDSIDQALLNRVVADVASGNGPDPAGTATIGSMTALRGACRQAKEELSTTTSTTLTAGWGGRHDDVRITRAELEDLVRPQLDGLLRVIQETLQRNGIQPGGLAAVAAVGGGAGMPVVTTRLSGQLGVPVIAAPRPAMTPAIGAALTAARRSVDDGATAPAPASSTDAMTDVVPTPAPAQALAWSEADDASGVLPIRTGEYPASRSPDATATVRPVSEQTAPARTARPGALPWYRRPAVLIIGTALVVLAIGAAVVIALQHTVGDEPTTPAPATPAPATESTEPSSAETQTPSSTPSSTASSTTTETPTTTQAPTTTTTEAPTTTSATSPPSSAGTTTQAPQSTGYPQRPTAPPGR